MVTVADDIIKYGLIPGEYKRPLAALDTRYHRVEEGQTGPLVRRLERFGNILTWVVGAWQEASKDLHDLLDLLADHKVAVLGLARGREATENERAQILSGYRRTLSTMAARANSTKKSGEQQQYWGSMNICVKPHQFMS